MWLKQVFALWKRERKKKGTTLHRRLLLFFVSVTLVLILTFALLLSMFGITGRDSKTVNNYFDVELANISDNISDDFGAISLTGIDIAEELTDLSEDFFLENGVAASDLKGRTDMIEPLLSEYMHTLLRTVGNQYCGGVFVMLDATINPESELSDTAKAGVFLKKTQPTQTASVGVDIHYLRGPAQLSRANESRSDKRPMLSDLRESGAIEQDADVVMFLYRDDYYNKDSDKRNQAECIIAKNRRGETTTIPLQWLPEFTTFSSLERHYEEPY